MVLYTGKCGGESKNSIESRNRAKGKRKCEIWRLGVVPRKGAGPSERDNQYLHTTRVQARQQGKEDRKLLITQARGGGGEKEKAPRGEHRLLLVE